MPSVDLSLPPPPPWTTQQTRPAPAVTHRTFPVPIAPGVKGQSLRQRIRHRHIEERVLGDTLRYRDPVDDGVLQHAKNVFPEEFEGRLNVLAAEYAFIGVYTGARDHFHRIFSLVDEAKRAAAYGRIPAMNAFLRSLILLSKHRP